MAYARFDIDEQIERVKRGVALDTSIESLAHCVPAEWYDSAAEQLGDSVEFCCRLYALSSDPL